MNECPRNAQDVGRRGKPDHISMYPALNLVWFLLPLEKVPVILQHLDSDRTGSDDAGHSCHSSVQFSSVAQSCLTLWEPMDCMQHTRLPCPSPTPRACSNSCPWSQQCQSTISSSVIPFSSCLQPFPTSGAFPMSQFFTSGGRSIGVSASASVLRMNIQHWFPLEWTGWLSLQSKGLSRAFSNTTVQKHQFFSAQFSL